MTRPARGGRRDPEPRSLLTAACGVVLLLLAGCGGDGAADAADPAETTAPTETLVVGGIPDQDPDRLQRQFDLVATRLEDLLGVQVRYEPVADYDAAVSAFRIGDLDLVWFGGLTGVQARLQVDGAEAILQRDIDATFRSVFIAGAATGIEPFGSVDGLIALAGRRFTFGSDSSTSGRLMPQHFLAEAGVALADLAGEPGFSGSHDATIALVEAGTYEAGALNEQVWDARVDEGTVDTTKVRELFRTPTYHDYHWVVRPDLADRLGAGIVERIVDAFTSLDPGDPADARILELFGAGAFVPTDDGDYDDIERVAREIGRIEG